jgi:hypothetical protein
MQLSHLHQRKEVSGYLVFAGICDQLHLRFFYRLEHEGLALGITVCSHAKV